MSGVVGRAVVGVVVVGLLAGCGGQEAVQDAGVSATPKATRTPSPTPTTIVGVVQDMSDPELGIVFEEVPELTGDEADVYNWIATYSQESWRTLKENRASPAFEVFTSAEVQQLMDEIAAANAAEGSEVGGTFRVRVSDIVVDGNDARGTTCDDYSGVEVANEDGPQTLEEAGVADPRLLEIALRRDSVIEGLWRVQTIERIGTC